MRKVAALLALLATGCASSFGTDIPLASGSYVFQHRFAEHPQMSSITFNVTIDGDKITLTNPKAADPFPAGIIEQGQLVWHQASSSWIIAHSDADQFAPEVGGCSEGPHVVDLHAKVYWTC